MASTSSILLVENFSQSAFFRLKRLLNVVGCATITGFTLTQIGRCGGFGSRTYFSHISELFDDENMLSGLYPFFHIALLNDFGSFALCMSDRLFDSAHSSTASPLLSVEVYPQSVLQYEACFCYQVEGAGTVQLVVWKRNVPLHRVAQL